MTEPREWLWHGPSFVHGVVTAGAWVAWGPLWGLLLFAAVLLADLVAAALLPPMHWSFSWKAWSRQMDEKPRGYVTNCYLHPPDDGTVCFDFGADPEGRLALVRLDKMALLPLELFDPAHPKHAGLMRSLAEVGANVRAGRMPWTDHPALQVKRSRR